MQITRMNIADLHEPEKNIRKHSDTQLEEFVRSLKMFGQTRPAVVDENNIILAGCGMYLALKKMGATEIDVIKRTDLTETQKKKLMIADNKIFEIGTTDTEALVDIISSIGRDELDVPGFDEDTLMALCGDVETINNQIESYGKLNEEDAAAIDRAEVRLAQPVAPTPVATPAAAPTSATPAPSAAPAPAPESTEEVRKCVICPNCGERIWLE